MNTPNFKETREAYTALLEKIVEASLRLGLELDKRQQSALAMLLDGASYREIAQAFGIPRSEAVTMARGAVDGLGEFLDGLGSIEKMQREMQREQDWKIESLKSEHSLQIQELNDEIAYLNRRLRSRNLSLLALSIHQLPIAPMLMSILLRAGYFTLDDVAKEERETLKALPGMTREMMGVIDKLIELSKVSLNLTPM